MSSTLRQQSNDTSDGVYETSTISKREYYTLRDKGLPLQPGQTMQHQQQQQQQQHQEAAAHKRSGKTKSVEVVMLDGSAHSFDMDLNASPQELFAETCEFLSLHEKEYFGLCYRDASNMFFWLDNEKKLMKQLSKAEGKLEFMVKFYPPDPENLHENLTRYYIGLQIRQNLMAGQLPCSLTTYIILGSYVLQSEAGDYDASEPDMVSLKYVDDCPFCPENQREKELVEMVTELHKCHRGMTPEEADLNFLNNAKKLAMYGVDLHEAKDARGEEGFVGVYHGGVVVYRNSLRVSRFSWPKIIKVSCKKNLLKLAIRTGDDRPKDSIMETIVEFKCASKKLAKRLWRAVVEHHGFFRLKAPEKPAKPLIPGTYKRNWNYTGPTAQQLNAQPYNAYPEVQVTSDMRKSFKKKDDAYNRELRQQKMQEKQQQLNNQGNVYVSIDPKKRQQRPDLIGQLPSQWHMCPADAHRYLAGTLDADSCSGSCPAGLSDWQGVRADHGVKGGGQWYYESTIAGNQGDGPVDARIGWSGENASLRLGEDARGWGYGTDPDGQHGCSVNNGKSRRYGGPDQLKPGDVVGAFVDLDAGTVQFAVNGEKLGEAFDLGGEAMGDQLQHEAIYPAACLRNGSQMSWNFGDNPDRPLRYPPQAPYHPVGLAPDRAENPRAWRLNPMDTSGQELQLAPDLWCAQAQLGTGWQGVRSDKGLKGSGGGKFYYEVEPMEDEGLARIGWSTEDGDLNVGRDSSGWGYGADYDGFGLGNNQGKRLHADEIFNYGEPFAKGDVIGCYMDLDTGAMQFSRNGRNLGQAYQLPRDRLQTDSFFPTVSMRDQTLDVNLGQRGFKYPPGDGWAPVCLADKNQVQRSRKRVVSTHMPSVDQRYDQIRQQKPQIRANYNAASPSVTVHESRTESEEIGEPEEEIVTYTDEHGNKVTKKVVRRKQMRQVVTSKLVETRGRSGFDPRNDTEHLERTVNPAAKNTMPVRKNLLLSDAGEEDDLLNDIIYQQTGFSKDEAIVDENVNDFSMSTIDTRGKKTPHESEI